MKEEVCDDCHGEKITKSESINNYEIRESDIPDFREFLIEELDKAIIPDGPKYRRPQIGVSNIDECRKFNYTLALVKSEYKGNGIWTRYIKATKWSKCYTCSGTGKVVKHPLTVAVDSRKRV